MPATIHLILGPPGAERLRPLVAAYREAASGFGEALFLLPTRRHAEQVRDSLTSGIAPLVFELQAFADELVRVHDPAIRPHSDADRRLLLDSVLAELRESTELPYFAAVTDTRGFANAAEGYIAELKEVGVDLRQLLKATPGRESGSGTRHHQATRIFERYHRRLAKLHRFDPPDRLGRAAELWAVDTRQPFHRVRSVFVAGFTSFTPFQRKLLDAVRETVEHVWLELPEGEGEAFAGPEAVRDWVTAPVGEA